MDQLEPVGAPVTDVTLRAGRPAVVGAAAAALGLEGLLLLLLGLQNNLFVRWRPPYEYAVWGLMASGALSAVLGVIVARVSVGGHLAAMAGSGVLFLASAGWVALSFGSGVISLLALSTIAGALVALALLIASLASCREAVRARAELRREGVEFNL